MTIDELIELAEVAIKTADHMSSRDNDAYFIRSGAIWSQMAQAAAATAQAKILRQMMNAPFGENGNGYLRIQEDA